MKIKAPRLCRVHSILLINQLKIQNLSQSNEINWSSFFDFRNKLVSEEKELRATINFNKILLIFELVFLFKLHFFVDSCCSNFGTSNGSRGFQRQGFGTAGEGRLGRRTGEQTLWWRLQLRGCAAHRRRAAHPLHVGRLRSDEVKRWHRRHERRHVGA